MEFHCISVTPLTKSILYLTNKYIIKIAILHIAECFTSDILTIAKKTIWGEKEEKRKKICNCHALTLLILVRRAPGPPSGAFTYYNDSTMLEVAIYSSL